jgi:hypothetical protein
MRAGSADGGQVTPASVERLIKLAIKYRCNLTVEGVTIVPHATAYLDPAPPKAVTKQTEAELDALMAAPVDPRFRASG